MRIATQMLQARKEYDVIRQNRIAREEQYADARAKEFQEALERESVCYLFHILKKYYFKRSQNRRWQD